MVGSNMLLQIHKRLQQLKGKGDDTTFGDISILAVGDLYNYDRLHSHMYSQRLVMPMHGSINLAPFGLMNSK